MAAAATDLFRESAPLFQTTLSAAMLATDTAATLASVVGIPTNTGVTITVDQFNAAGTATPTLREVMTGVVSGSQIIDLIRGQDGTTAQSHANGAIVQMVFTSQANNDLMTGITKQHTQSGAHTGITTDTLTASGLITAAGGLDVSGGTLTFQDGSVSTTALTNPYKFSAYLGSAQTVSTGTWTQVALNTITFDTSSNFSTSNHEFTAPVAGFYFFTGFLLPQMTASTFSNIGINVGTFSSAPTYGGPSQESAASATLTMSVLVSLTAGETVQLYGVSGSTYIYSGSLSGFLVSQT